MFNKNLFFAIVLIMEAANVIKYYVLCNKLKNMIRVGWEAWEVDAPRIESVAEHVYGALMVAVAMYSEYNYDLDFSKVLLMLAIHETEEILIGDLTPFQASREEKQKKGHEAVIKVFASLAKRDELISLVNEYDARKTPEAKFAYQCDKLEADLQCKLYDEAGGITLRGQENNPNCSNDLVRKLLKSEQSFSSAWSKYTEGYVDFYENFLAVEEYVRKHRI